MILNNIELNGALLSELYKGNLVAGTTLETRAVPDKRVEASGAASTGGPASDMTLAAAAGMQAGDSPPSTGRIAGDSALAAAAGVQGDSPASTAEAAAPVVQAGGYKFLGGNKRRISIIVDSPAVAFLPDDQLAFLGKMLEACKMNIADVAIVNQATARVDIAVLKTQLNPAFVLLFGPGPIDIKLPMNFPAFRVQPYDDCTYLSSPSLAALTQPGDEARQLKGKLWAGLKTMFNI